MNIGENPQLKEIVEGDNELKKYIVNYVGSKIEPENEEVTVEMVVEVIAKDFPEFLMVVAEENWIRGYHQAFIDLEEAHKQAEPETETPAEEEDAAADE